jgi:MerR family transcriptional regulator, copper efflux regulator
MQRFTVGGAAAQTGWSPRMLRYLESVELVVPSRTRSGYRSYGIRDLNQLRALRDLRERFAVELDDVAFAARLAREPELRSALETWLSASAEHGSSLAWEQRKHERLLAA